MRTMRVALATGGALLAMTATAGSAAASGVTGLAFYVDGVRYRTVVTPTDLSGTGAPGQSWDVIYSFGSAQPSVATAAPGDRDFNGGRWQVHALSFPGGYAAALSSADKNGNHVIDSDTELGFALGDGTAVDTGVVKYFVCTVNPVPQGKA